MNIAILIGRLTKDAEVRYTNGENPMCIARYTLAVDRRTKENETDFIPCVAFGKNGEFAEKYFKKGMKVCVTGTIQTGNYTNKDGQKVYTTDVIVNNQEFAEKKAEASASAPNGEEFMQIPEGEIDDLPFN